MVACLLLLNIAIAEPEVSDSILFLPPALQC